MAKVILTIKERLAVADMLRDVLVDNTDGTWSYANGWSDARVAEKVGGRTNTNHVNSVRIRAFGPLPKTRPAPDVGELSDRLSALEARLSKLEEALGGC
jgi:hypothetical protein